MENLDNTSKLDNSIKIIVKYALLIIVPLIIALTIIFLYNNFLLLEKNLSNFEQNEPSYNDNVKATTPEQSKNIKRLSYLKYSHTTGNDESIYLIEIVKIGNCKYIIVSKKNQDPVIIHAKDCDYLNHARTKTE